MEKGDKLRAKVIAATVAFLLIGVAALVPSVLAPIPDTWTKGDEVAITGHSFDEEYWTSDISNTSDGATTTMTMSYVNHADAQAFLLAFKTYEKDGNVSTLPYQLFGMHYKNTQDRDVFIGAILAFLMAFNDTYNGTGPGENGMPDPGHESVYYIVPFGVGGTLTNGTYVPEVSAIAAQKLGDGHYRFGMRYRNMYAKIIDASNPFALLLSTAYPLYIAKFSEFTVTYNIKYHADGRLTAETFYTLGQVTKLWLWGIEVDPQLIPDNWGISVVHYVATFGSTYTVTGNTTGHTIDTNIQHPVGEDLNLKVGNPPRRVFDVGFRGKFNLIDESTSTIVRANQDARNLIVKATLTDGLLVLWQGAYSLGVMATMAYALSPDLQSRFSGPLDLAQHGFLSFFTSTLWYAVSFPRWDCYRVEHDPVYTAYLAPPAEDSKISPIIGLLLLAIISLVILAVVVAALSRRKRAPRPPGPPI